MKKIYIIIGSIIAIVVTLAFITPLTQSIKDMTNEQLIDFIDNSNITYVGDNINPGYIQATYTSDNIPTYIEDMNIRFNENNDGVSNSPAYLSRIIEIKIYIGGVAFDNAVAITLENTNLSDSIVNDLYNAEMVYISFIDLYDLILENDYIWTDSTAGGDYPTPISSALFSSLDIRKIIIYNHIAPALLSDNFDDYINFITYSSPQISGTTATLLNIIPFVLISATVLTTTVLIKKEGD